VCCKFCQLLNCHLIHISLSLAVLGEIVLQKVVKVEIQAAAEAMEIGNVEALRQRLERDGTSTR